MQETTKEKRTREILDAALMLFDTCGYRKTTVKQIAEQVGVSKALVFKYFPAKIDILFSLFSYIDICLDECLKEETPLDVLTEFSKRLTSTTDAYIPPMRIYMSSFIKGDLPEGITRNFINDDFARTWIEPVIKSGQEQNQFRQGDSYEMAQSFWLYLLGAVVHYVNNREKKDYHANLEIAFRMLTEE